MKKIIKISLIAPLLFTVNLFGWTETETQQKVNTNTAEIQKNDYDIQKITEDINDYKSTFNSKISTINNNINTLESDVWNLKQNSSGGSNNNLLQNEVSKNTSNLEEISKTINNSDIDGIDISKKLYGTYNVEYGQDDISINLVKKGVIDEIYGSYKTNFNYNTNKKTTTLIEKGLIQKVDYLMNNQNISPVDLTEVNNNITQNTNRLNKKDIKDSQQDTQINSNTNRIIKVEKNVSTLISNSSKFNNRLDTQSKKLTELERKLSKIDKRENQKIASGMATNLTYDFSNGNKSFAYNFSNFNGESALGFGYAYRKNGAIFSVSLGTDFTNVGFKTQASFSF